MNAQSLNQGPVVDLPILFTVSQEIATENAENCRGLLKTHLCCKNAFWPFKVVRGRWFLYESKRVCDFIVARNLISCTVPEILQVFCSWPHSYVNVTLILGVFPLDHIARVGISPSKNLKLFGREIVLEVCETCLNFSDRHTDRQTDSWHTVA